MGQRTYIRDKTPKRGDGTNTVPYGPGANPNTVPVPATPEIIDDSRRFEYGGIRHKFGDPVPFDISDHAAMRYILRHWKGVKSGQVQ